jgi:hypothetical protein
MMSLLRRRCSAEGCSELLGERAKPQDHPISVFGLRKEGGMDGVVVDELLPQWLLVLKRLGGFHVVGTGVV